MKSRPSRILSLAALLVLLAGAATWVATGAHVGWTQTSTVTQQRDEITGIVYPVRQPGFIAGVEVPAGAAVLAAILAGLGWTLGRRGSARA